MSGDEDCPAETAATHDGSGTTRRKCLAAGGALAAGGLLAGCTGSGSTDGGDAGTPTGGNAGGASPGATAETGPKTGTDPATPTDAPSPTPGGSATGTDRTGSYTAALAPAGEVTFESVPKTVFTNLGHHTEMALALGRGDGVNATYAPEYVDSLVSAFTARLDGVAVDWTDLTVSWGASRETVYELDSDVHLADPATMVTMEAWDRSALEEVATEVGPWFGNTYSDRHSDPPATYADDYRYYTLWEIFGRVAGALRERARYDALRTVRDDLLATVESGLPPEDERPTVAMVLNSTSGDAMWAYDVNATGFHASHTRPFGVRNALDAVGSFTNGDKIDYETLLAADPDVILTLGGVVDAHDMRAIRATLADDPVASQVTAVDEGRVYAQGTRHQGPLVNLFQLEMTAKQLFPDAFGEWPAYETGPYPRVPDGEQLFDHDRVASVIADGV